MKIKGTLIADNLVGSGNAITNLNASNLYNGTVPTSVLGTGSASSSTYLRGDHTWAALSIPTISASGSDTQIQYNDGGNFAGSSALTFNKITNTLNAVSGIFTGYISGSGDNIVNLNASNISTGTLNSARLPTTVALLNATSNTFTNSIVAGNFIETVSFTIDGGGLTLASGYYGFREVQASGTVVGITLLGSPSGTCYVDIRKCTYTNFPTTTSVVAAAIPGIASGIKYQDTTLSGWTTTIATGDILEFRIPYAPSGLTIIQGFLKIKRT